MLLRGDGSEAAREADAAFLFALAFFVSDFVFFSTFAFFEGREDDDGPASDAASSVLDMGVADDEACTWPVSQAGAAGSGFEDVDEGDGAKDGLGGSRWGGFCALSYGCGPRRGGAEGV